MNFHRAFAAFWLALALLAGQEAAALHRLSHAFDRLPHDQSTPAKPACDQCFLGAQLAGAVGVDEISVAPVAFDSPRPLCLRARVSPTPALLAFRSRAPPELA